MGGRIMTATDATLATARALMDAHGLRDWSLAVNNARRMAGQCDYQKRTITLSRFILAQRSDADNLNTITHEIAHALTRGHHHDRVWQLKHRALGGDGRRCYEATLVDDSAPYVATCDHGVQYHRYRAPRPGATFRCRCGGGQPFAFIPNPKRGKVSR